MSVCSSASVVWEVGWAYTRPSRGGPAGRTSTSSPTVGSEEESDHITTRQLTPSPPPASPCCC